MKRTLIALLAATAVGAGVPALANAQDRYGYDRYDRGYDRSGRDYGGWNVGQAEAEFEQRLDASVRSGALNRSDAARLETRFREIVRLERQYSNDGMMREELADLDNRFRLLLTDVPAPSAGDRGRYADRGGRDRADRWENLNQRQSQFEQRLNAAVRDGRIDRRSAGSLQSQFNAIARLEQQYRRDGLTRAERADLDNRFNQLQVSFRGQVSANQYAYGYNQAPNLFDYLFGLR